VITWHKAVFSWLVMRLVMRPVVCKQHETVQLRSGLISGLLRDMICDMLCHISYLVIFVQSATTIVLDQSAELSTNARRVGTAPAATSVPVQSLKMHLRVVSELDRLQPSGRNHEACMRCLIRDRNRVIRMVKRKRNELPNVVEMQPIADTEVGTVGPFTVYFPSGFNPSADTSCSWHVYTHKTHKHQHIIVARTVSFCVVTSGLTPLLTFYSYLGPLHTGNGGLRRTHAWRGVRRSSAMQASTHLCTTSVLLQSL